MKLHIYDIMVLIKTLEQTTLIYINVRHRTRYKGMWRITDDTRCGEWLASSLGRFTPSDERAGPTAGLNTSLAGTYSTNLDQKQRAVTKKRLIIP